MQDTTNAARAVAEKFDRLFDLALNTTPSNDNGYRLVLGVLLVLVALAILDRYFANRKADRYRDRQEAKADARWDAEQKRLSDDAEKASVRAIAEQASREAAREKVIDEQRKNADQLRKQFGAALSPLESRIATLESEQREHNDTIILLRFKAGIDKKPHDKEE